MIGSEYFGIQFRLAALVVPVALYFLVLGLLNSRRTPQLLSARQDLATLMVALSPLAIFPAMDQFGTAGLLAIGLVAAAVAIWMLIRPAGSAWVVYNLEHEQALQALEQSLKNMGLKFERQGRWLVLPDHNAQIEVSSFPLLRNVSVRLRGGDRQMASHLAGHLAAVLNGMEVQTSTMAVALLVVATAMLLAPVASIVSEAPEIVRILTDLLP